MKSTYKSKNVKRIPWVVLLVALIAVIALSVATFAQIRSNQSDPAFVPDLCFCGEYRIEGGEWQPITEGRHISATRGTVELKGYFRKYDRKTGEELGAAGGGTVISMYLDHVKATVKNSNGDIWVSDNENDLYGKGVCAATRTEYELDPTADENLIITIYNPHVFGNAGAVDSFLKNVKIHSVSERGILSSFKPMQLVIAAVIFVFLLILLGAAIFATLLHRQHCREVWLLWMLVLFGGIFLVFSREQISIWNPMYAANTVILGSSMMMYFVTAYAIITSFLKGFVKKIATVVTAVVGAGSVMAMLLSVITSLDFYDTYVFWTVLSVVAASVIAVCMIINVSRSSKDGWDKTNLVFIPAGALIVAFILDVIFALFGIWQNGAISIAVLFAIVIASSVVIGRVVPKSISAILEAKNIEAERQAMELKLQESRISIMLSQIQPHFLYNTLNSIYHLCETNPMLARSLVNSFSEYLRNNLSSLEQTGLVPFETELSHVKTYLDIEKVRFEDTLDIEYDIKCVDFALPVLTVQPIVENAVKHGTSKKRGGGRVVVATFEEREFYVIRVTDTGCGFDPGKPKNDGKRHIGIENARQRLSNMCQGSLTIESEIGVGTVATIRIPKGDEK